MKLRTFQSPRIHTFFLDKVPSMRRSRNASHLSFQNINISGKVTITRNTAFPSLRARLTLSALQINTNTFVNIVDPDEMARNKPYHLDLHNLPLSFQFCTHIPIEQWPNSKTGEHVRNLEVKGLNCTKWQYNTVVHRKQMRDGWMRQRCCVSFVSGASSWYWLTVGQSLLSLQQVRVEGECFNFYFFTFIHFPPPLSFSFISSTISSISLLPFSGRQHKMAHKGWRVVKSQHNRKQNKRNCNRKGHLGTINSKTIGGGDDVEGA